MVTNAFCGHKIGNFNINFNFKLVDQYFWFFLSKTILKHSRFLYKQHFDKQQHDKIGKKN